METARLCIIVVGILLPCLTRIPGAFFHGLGWLTAMFGSGPEALLFLGLFNAVCWGSIVLAVRSYHNPRSAWFPSVLGFAFPVLGYASVDLTAASTAAIALVLIPFYSLPLVFAGWLVGRSYDRRVRR